MQTRGTIPPIIRNDDNLYRGNLIPYFRAIFNHARNLQHPYHNFRHVFHVTWLTYQACVFYRTELTQLQMRELLIASMFHDFDHNGMLGDDDLNIAKAIRGLERHLDPSDKESLPAIVSLIEVTEYPYKIASDQLELSAQIIRDADLGQSLSVAWIQQIIFGLAAEWHKTPIEVLKMQAPFVEKLRFTTEWAQKMFPANDIAGKVQETKDLLALLED